MAVCTAAVETVPAPHVDERQLNQQPETDKTDQSAQRDGGRRGISPNEKVEDKDCGEEKSRHERCSDDGVVFPQCTVESLVDASGEISTESAGEDEQCHADTDEAASEAGIENTKARENDQSDRHDNELHAGSNERSE